MPKELKDDELEKVGGGLSINGDGTYYIKAGDTFETASQGDRTIYEVQDDHPSAVLDSYIRVYVYEYINNEQGGGKIEIMLLKDIFNNCNVSY